MNRRSLSWLLLILLSLQSVTAAATFFAASDAPVAMASMPDDCAGDCCDETCKSTADCAIYCAAYSIQGSQVPFRFVASTGAQVDFIAQVSFAPHQPPLKPPPIS